ncbi:cytochrome C assembly protein [Anaerobacillus alkalidiazotrophicus]|uniref:Cytochrome C assembly protein n=1 Tax=Anaerobacillus alkalidiazotrophicus TaxID=472963 RepID=A0A1S2M0V3_9BACI|nr:cytochrome c biogenesis protein CcsA [Anaerobacillus alkalidiazotrophicus]OIJ18349.1 cytochrome C assembly protein [Anaerobacillus alkalidiazotrophicus]OIJ19828.1 cytochrome C assembly protein [Anaerobacillus alkalidiazotrophicus]
MLSMNFIYIFTVILYCLSVIGYFIDFLQNNQKVNRISFWLLSIVWVLQTIFFVLRMLEYNRLPLMTSFEGLFFYAWIIVSVSLVINWFFKVDFFVFFTNIFGFAIMAFSVFIPTGDISPNLQELLIVELLFIHVTLILLAYGSFTFAFIFSIMYYYQHQMLKKKRWSKRLFRFGDLSKSEHLVFMFTVLGFPLLLMGVFLGLVWAALSLEQVPWFDAKIVTSVLVLFVYGYYLYQRVVKKIRGYSLVLLNIAGFLLVLINYFLSGSLSKFHLWY